MGPKSTYYTSTWTLWVIRPPKEVLRSLGEQGLLRSRCSWDIHSAKASPLSARCSMKARLSSRSSSAPRQSSLDRELLMAEMLEMLLRCAHAECLLWIPGSELDAMQEIGLACSLGKRCKQATWLPRYVCLEHSFSMGSCHDMSGTSFRSEQPSRTSETSQSILSTSYDM